MTDTRETRASASEIKFLLDEGHVPAIRAWARANLQPDPHGGGPFADAYTTSTLYFDTRQLDVFHRRSSFGRAKYRVSAATATPALCSSSASCGSRAC